MKTVEPEFGRHIKDTIDRMIALAKKSGEEVTCKFNDQDIFVNAKSDANLVEKAYHDQVNARHQKWLASPEGQESVRRQEAARKRCEASIARGLSTFQIRDQATWDRGLEKNQDPYGLAVYRYASRWAALMEERMAKGATVADVAKQSGLDCDEEGITGFMYGCAVSILAVVWKHGEQLRRWHNLKTQLGNEGERANESGDVLNPAVLTIGGEP